MKEGRKEGRQAGMQEGRKEGRKDQRQKCFINEGIWLINHVNLQCKKRLKFYSFEKWNKKYQV